MLEVDRESTRHAKGKARAGATGKAAENRGREPAAARAEENPLQERAPSDVGEPDNLGAMPNLPARGGETVEIEGKAYRIVYSEPGPYMNSGVLSKAKQVATVQFVGLEAT